VLIDMRRWTIIRIVCSAIIILIMPAQAAREMNGFKLTDALVSPRKIESGGPPKDGIPALFAPRFVPADQASYLNADERVLGVAYNDIVKAYPIKILNYHEIANDQFGDAAVAVTFCPLCGTGIAFLADTGGQKRTFGVSGLLYNSDVLMYDRETESLWSQIMAQAISGPASGTRLRPIPVLHTTWGNWLTRYPDSLVLKPPTAYGRNYNVSPYQDYATSSDLMFSVAHSDSRYATKSVVLGIKIGELTKAYPFEELPTNTDTLYDTLSDHSIVVKYDVPSQTGWVLDQDGKEIPSFTAYWFAWVAFHPDTDVFTRQ
jgi:hypothetical protein